MNALLRRRLEMAARARDFLRAHQSEVQSEATALTRLEELLERAQTLEAQQQNGLVATHAASARREELRHTLQRTLLKFLAAVATVAAKANTDLLIQVRLPRRVASNQSFLSAARRILTKATVEKDLLIAQGLSTTLFDDMAKALTGFEQTLESTRAGRRDHTGASADLGRITTEIGEQVRLLDGLVRYRFGDNAELMGAWNSARNEVGPSRSHIQPDAGTPETPTEVQPNAVKPAA